MTRDRRKIIFVTCLVTLATAAIAAAPVAFMATTFYPVAWWGLAVIVPTFTGAAWWVIRDACQAEQKALAQDETEVLPLDAIANHMPAAPRAHRFDAAWWRKARRAARRRIKEGVS